MAKVKINLTAKDRQYPSERLKWLLQESERNHSEVSSKLRIEATRITEIIPSRIVKEKEKGNRDLRIKEWDQYRWSQAPRDDQRIESYHKKR